MRSSIIASCAALVAGISIWALALGQPQGPKVAPAGPKYGKMRLWAKVGSFTLEGEGRVEMTFTGTLLLNNFSGTATVTGNVRKEFEGMGRRAWFGTGKAVLVGRFRRVLWFGKNVNCYWSGRGLAMVYGEFDQQQQTGFTQVDNEPAYPWLTTGRPFYLPVTDTPGYFENKKARPPAGAPGGPRPLKGG